MMLSAMKRYICLSILLVTCFHAFPELEKDRTGYILCRKKKATVRLADHKMPSSISHPLEDWNRLVALDHSNLASCILAQFGLGLWPFQVSRVLHRRRKKGHGQYHIAKTDSSRSHKTRVPDDSWKHCKNENYRESSTCHVSTETEDGIRASIRPYGLKMQQILRTDLVSHGLGKRSSQGCDG